MPIKDLDDRNKYRREYYKHNSKHFVNKVRERKRVIRKWFDDYKIKLKCEKCGESHPATIDFHHRKPNQKEASIAKLVAEGYSAKRIQLELNKCMVLCSNCHRKLHFRNSNL